MGTMESRILYSDKFTSDFKYDLLNRDIVLWTGKNVSDVDTFCKIFSLPWQFIICESTSEVLLDRISDESSIPSVLYYKRGFTHFISNENASLDLPSRVLPVYLPNGRHLAIDDEDSDRIIGLARQRRYLNVLGRLEEARPKRVLLVLSEEDDDVLRTLIQLWEEGFRTLISVVPGNSVQEELLKEWVNKRNSPSSILLFTGSFNNIVSDLYIHILNTLQESIVTVKVRNRDDSSFVYDVTSCDLPETPILEKYNIINSRDLIYIQASDLSYDEFCKFFSKENESWAPYAAGVPWTKDKSILDVVLALFRRLEAAGSDENKVLYIKSQSGAGGTTLARSIAFDCAAKGYPTLIARKGLIHPTATEVANFMLRVHRLKVSEGVNTSVSSEDETPWLIVFEEYNWGDQSSEISKFVRELKSLGRPAIVLNVTENFSEQDFHKTIRPTVVAELGHTLSNVDVLNLGSHLNKFLRNYGKARSDSEWVNFYNRHSTGITTNIASFWISLEFWLKGHIDLEQTIQSWLYSHFTKADLSKHLQLTLAEMAAVSLQKLPLPEGVIPSDPSSQFPLSVELENVRQSIPALGLVTERVDGKRIWGFAHDLLARYLLNSIYYDRNRLNSLGLSQAEDPIEFRIYLLERVASRGTLGSPAFREFALLFPTRIFKLEPDSNPEFLSYWKRIIKTLESMPPSLLATSRTFNHHLAISRRRIATINEVDATIQEKIQQIRLAIKELNFALEIKPDGFDAESDLNILNSLALAYQNLADILLAETGLSSEVQELRRKANETTQRALREDPTSPFVLETAARNLIQNAQLQPSDSITCAGQALAYVFQASRLDGSEERKLQLTKLANTALRLLRVSGGDVEAEKLAATGNPLGHVAKTLLLLSEGEETLETYDLTGISQKNSIIALEYLEKVPSKGHWLVLRLYYDLVSCVKPIDFEKQLEILDELIGARYPLPPQLLLERAILLYQCNRHMEGSDQFTQLRQELKLRDIFVSIPKRLKWLLARDRNHKMTCEARISGDGIYRLWAKVSQLKNTSVPFVPQEFGFQTAPVGKRFACYITFTHNGPLAKPPINEGELK